MPSSTNRYTAFVAVVSFKVERLAMSVILASPSALVLKIILRRVLSMPSFFIDFSISCEYLPLTWEIQKRGSFEYSTVLYWEEIVLNDQA